MSTNAGTAVATASKETDFVLLNALPQEMVAKAQILCVHIRVQVAVPACFCDSGCFLIPNLTPPPTATPGFLQPRQRQGFPRRCHVYSWLHLRDEASSERAYVAFEPVAAHGATNSATNQPRDKHTLTHRAPCVAGIFWEWLSTVGLKKGAEVEPFGSVEGLIASMIRMKYIVKITVPSNEQDNTFFRWGQRARREISEKSVVTFLALVRRRKGGHHGRDCDGVNECAAVP